MHSLSSLPSAPTILPIGQTEVRDESLQQDTLGCQPPEAQARLAGEEMGSLTI